MVIIILRGEKHLASLYHANSNSDLPCLNNFETLRFTMNIDNYAESDEAFARRLQAQEMGQILHGVPGNNADAQTPLMVATVHSFVHNTRVLIYIIRLLSCEILLICGFILDFTIFGV